MKAVWTIGPETIYRIIQDNHVSSVFTSPTAVRLLMRFGADIARRFDLSSLHERVFCAGEVLNPPASSAIPTDLVYCRSSRARPASHCQALRAPS